MAEVVIDTFTENSKLTFDVSKLNFLEKAIDNLYKDNIGNMVELKLKTKKRIQSLFK